MHMLKVIPAAAIILAGCIPPPDVPPPRFRPNPPYAPDVVDPMLDDRQSYQTPTPPPPPTRPGEYPTAQATANPNEVLSPYEPYNVINIEGFNSGQLARDPSNNQIFRVP